MNLCSTRTSGHSPPKGQHRRAGRLQAGRSLSRSRQTGMDGLGISCPGDCVGAHALQIRNKLLAALDTEDLEHLAPHLSEIRTRQGDLLEEPGRALDAVYFPQSGMVSL